MALRISAVLYLLLSAFYTNAQDLGSFEKHWLAQSGDTLPYRILLPKEYDPAKKYPLVLFLHGRGESGNDNEKQLVHGARLFLQDSVRTRYPAIVIFPQCPASSYWSNVIATMEGSKTSKRTFRFIETGEPSLAMRFVTTLTNLIIKNYPVDKARIYVMGLSMGGMGTFEIVRRMPGTFAAAVPICGGASPATAALLTKVKWWIFHGAKDDVVPPSFSEMMVAALRKAKASVKFTLYPQVNHNSWDPAFAEPGLLPWLFAQRKNSSR